MNQESSFDGTIFPKVNEEYAKSLNLNDLSEEWRDRKGRKKGDAGFKAPIPKVAGGKNPQFVVGGYNPATWTGTADNVVQLDNGFIPPQMTPKEVLQLMSDAFDDEGDVAAFNPFRDELGGQPYQLDKNGHGLPLEAPGIGIDVDENFLAAHPLIDGPCYV